MTAKRKRSKETISQNTYFKSRFVLVSIVLAMLPIALIVRFTVLQVLPQAEQGYSFLQRQGDARSVRTEEIPAFRGMITDRNGDPLAVSTPMTTIVMNPRRFFSTVDSSEREALLERLAGSAGLNSAELKQRVENARNRQFLYIVRKLPPPQGDEVLALRIPGVRGQTEYQRYYPAGEVAAHVVGFTDIDDNGQEGVELLLNERLSGHAGQRTVVRDLLGNTIRDLGQTAPAEAGENVRLTIDMRLQYIAYRELKAAVTRHQASGGSIVVVDITNGEILAMANQPSFNPNNRASFIPGTTRNRALTDVFEPGSTAKPLTMSYALDSGQFTADSVISTAPGWIVVDGKTLLDPVNYGDMTLTRIITKSSQVGTTKIALELDPNDVRDRFYQFGFGQQTWASFPGESIGVIPDRFEWRDIERANFAFGYGFNVTATQLVGAYATLANQGVRPPLHLIDEDYDFSRDNVRVTSPQTAQAIIEMMSTVTSDEGSGRGAQIPGYDIAGKTGTAHKVGRGGYLGDSYTALFAGVAPSDRPRLAAVIVIDEPTAGGHFGGQVAAPAFGRVMADALRLLNVPPTRETLR
ncbi:MAG: penicillin-binding protein 2 [Gammaproteobacteria bacterium]|nr:penicillin-binding protein 2 [Gammaproteobacteria bacterium]